MHFLFSLKLRYSACCFPQQINVLNTEKKTHILNLCTYKYIIYYIILDLLT